MEKLDLTQILKDCPKGTKLYSPLFGDVTFEAVDTDCVLYPIKVIDQDACISLFTADGKYYNGEDAECLLFPSKDNRDWSTFKVEQPKAEQPQEFAPFEKVLVRDYNHEQWVPQFYCIYDEGDAYPHICMGTQFKQCIPYEGNEHLLGTNNEPKGKGE